MFMGHAETMMYGVAGAALGVKALEKLLATIGLSDLIPFVNLVVWAACGVYALDEFWQSAMSMARVFH